MMNNAGADLKSGKFGDFLHWTGTSKGHRKFTSAMYFVGFPTKFTVLLTIE